MCKIIILLDSMQLLNHLIKRSLSELDFRDGWRCALVVLSCARFNVEAFSLCFAYGLLIVRLFKFC